MEDDSSPLIPGIPNDIALNCLIRVPVDSHNAMIKVSKGWRKLLLDRNSLFYRVRSQLGLHQPMVFLAPNIYNIQQKFMVTRFFDKGARFCPYKSLILVFGGEQGSEYEHEIGFRTKNFYIVDTLNRKIRRGPDMVFPTSAYAHSAFGILNDCLYVAGGLKKGHSQEAEDNAEWSTSAQCYGISSNTWRPICPMPFQVLPTTFFVAHGDFVVTGMNKDASDGLHYYLSYSPVSDSWKVIDGTECMKKLMLVTEDVRQELEEETTDNEDESDDHDDDDDDYDDEEEDEKEESDDDDDYDDEEEDEEEESDDDNDIDSDDNEEGSDDNNGDEDEEDGCDDSSVDDSDREVDKAFEKKLKERVKEITGLDDGPLTTEASYFGMFVLGVTDKDDEGFKWKNMGDVGRLLQDPKLGEFHSDLKSLLSREILPSISVIDDVNGKELKFKARFKIVHYTGIKTPHHSKWNDLPLLFYPVCGQFSMDLSKFTRIGCMLFDFVVVYY